MPANSAMCSTWRQARIWNDHCKHSFLHRVTAAATAVEADGSCNSRTVHQVPIEFAGLGAASCACLASCVATQRQMSFSAWHNDHVLCAG